MYLTYDTATRNQFDADTQVVLDLIYEQYPSVEIQFPVNGKRDQWFVQIYRNGPDHLPEGFFGDTSLQAAARVARALKIELDPTIG